MHDSQVQYIKSLVSLGAITPKEGAAGFEMMKDAIGLEQDLHDVYSKPGATAQDYHNARYKALHMV